jgi:hypothetical protein
MFVIFSTNSPAPRNAAETQLAALNKKGKIRRAVNF